ncbi:hypothetical protein Acr_04g0002200 [Actinidia rufa]|uniref:Uncharacterized protein n=1 Tax=Actinidia rufa TaxID=165716 RepID=A0A7J0EGT6_9ERIC|nr:hypothetical protein Acr_04g0002200 [Actinidia rufa]
MELNRAQLLVHNDAILNKYRTNHGIPEDWKPLMRQLELAFNASNLLHVYLVVHPKRESNTPFFKDFNDLFRNRSEECKVAIRAINNRRALRKVADLLAYELTYCHVIPHKANKLSRIRLLALRIEGWEEGITLSSPSYTSSDSSNNKEEEGEEVVSQLVLNRQRG